MSCVFIGIGSNEGDRFAMISKAVQYLKQLPDVRVVQMAPIIETEPVGPPQEQYLNTVIEVETTLPPQPLFQYLQNIERQLGRQPSSERWGPRPIDLDLLLYDDLILNQPGLIVPHPRMHERQFVLQPLAQLAPDVVHPILKEFIATLLKHTTTPSKIL